MRIPLGEREGQRLEFKAAEALSDAGTLARDIVGLLNAEGGDLWIGLREENEYAVALDPVPDPDRAVRSLRDHLVDTIEPAPNAHEIVIEAVSHESGGAAIRVAVRPTPARKPFAYMRGTARHFVTRFGGRLRPMTRDEIVRSEGAMDRDRAEAEQRLLTSSSRVKSGLWVGIAPVPRQQLNLYDPRYEALFMDPKASGNREAGWQPVNPYKKPDPGQESLVQDTPGLCRVDLRMDGGIELVVPRPSLAWWEESLHPFALIEYPTSVFRLARAVYELAGLQCDVLAQLGLFDVGGLALRPGSPRHAVFKARDARAHAEGSDIVLSPRRMTMHEIIEAPDRCAARLWREVYAAFGFGKDAWPPEYEEATGRLVIPR